MLFSSASTRRSSAGLRLPEQEDRMYGKGPINRPRKGDTCSDGEKALRYNRRGPVMGRGQVARHRVLVPGSQVRILPPQPRSVWYATAG
jgi:hypothetical protein